MRGAALGMAWVSFAGCSAFAPDHARFDRQGLDSEVVDFRASNPSKGQFFYRDDGDPSGGGNAGARLSKARCVDPLVLTHDGGLRMLECGSMGGTVTICQNKQRPTE